MCSMKFVFATNFRRYRSNSDCQFLSTYAEFKFVFQSYKGISDEFHLQLLPTIHTEL